MPRKVNYKRAGGSSKKFWIKKDKLVDREKETACEKKGKSDLISSENKY